MTYLLAIFGFLKTNIKFDLWAFLKKYWFIIPIVILSLLYVHKSHQLTDVTTTLKTVTTNYTTAKNDLKKERDDRKKDQETAAKLTKATKAKYEQTISVAVTKYDNVLSSLKPVEQAATRTVKEYAKTSDGQSTCLDPSGVQRFETQRNLLYSKSTTPAATTP